MKISNIGKKEIRYRNIPKVYIELAAYNKMRCYIQLCDKEVGWLSTAYKVGNAITITDAFLFDQEVHATTCELTPGGIADFVVGLYNTMDTDEAMEISNNLTCWGHSHVNMGVSPSPQDNIQLQSFSTSGHDWFLRVIGNKKGELEFTYIDYISGLEIQGLDWELRIPELDITELKKDISVEVSKKVREKKTFSRGDIFGLNNHSQIYNHAEWYGSSVSSVKTLIDDHIQHEYNDIDIEYDDIVAEIVTISQGMPVEGLCEIIQKALEIMSIEELLEISGFEKSIDADAYMENLVGNCLNEYEMDEIYLACQDCREGLLAVNKIEYVNSPYDTDSEVIMPTHVKETSDSTKPKPKRGRPRKNK